MSSSWRRIIRVSNPLRRWVGATVMAATPAAGSWLPPGTVSWKLMIAPVATSLREVNDVGEALSRASHDRQRAEHQAS